MNEPLTVRRPPGLTLAILLAVLLFGIYPLIKAYFAWRLDSCIGEMGISCGIDVLPFDAISKLLAVAGGLVILTAIGAWWGRPPQVRFGFQAAVLFTALLMLVETYLRTTMPPNNNLDSVVLTSGSEFFENALRCQIPIQIVTAIYIIWYCNRAPARAFYHQEPLRSWQEKE